MSFCQNCGENNPDTSKFCFRCGKPLGSFVPANQPPAPMQNDTPVDDLYATQRVQMPFEEPAPTQTNAPYEEPAYNQPAFEQSMPYNEPAFQQYNQNQFNNPYNNEPPKKKKSKTPIIAVCAILVILIVAAAALIFTHTICLFHEYSEATCTEAAVCTYCDKEGDEAFGHKWKDATCTEAKKCETCEEVEGEALGHTWKDATCTEAKICTVCNETEGEALGHNYTGGSCTEASMCSRCYEMGTEAPGHSEGDWVVTDEATLNGSGREEKRCERCGVLVDYRTISMKTPQIKTDSFNFGHEEFVEWIENDISDLGVDYNYEIDEDGYIYYDVWVEGSYDEGFMMFEVNSAGEVTSMLFYFDDVNETLAASLAILVAEDIAPSFSNDNASYAFANGDDSYIDAGLIIKYMRNGEYFFAAIAPSAVAESV